MCTKGVILFILFCFWISSSFAELRPIRKPAIRAISKVVVARSVKVGTKHANAKVKVKALGALPGGYSKQHAEPSKKPVSQVTFGIVSKLDGSVFVLHAGKPEMSEVKVGEGILTKDLVWLGEDAKLEVVGKKGEILLLFGPTILGIQSETKSTLFSGVIKIIGGHEYEVSNPILNIAVSGNAFVWASRNEVQIVSEKGISMAWHPEMSRSETSTQILPGFFSSRNLQDHTLFADAPVALDAEQQAHLTERFEEIGVGFSVEKAVRSLASKAEHLFKGSRNQAHQLAAKEQLTSPDLYSKMLMARVGGESWPDRMLDGGFSQSLVNKSAVSKKSEKASRSLASKPNGEETESEKVNDGRQGRRLDSKTEKLIRSFIDEE